jgi:putative redox protein
MSESKRQIEIEWKGGLAFEAHPPSGNSWHMDAYSDAGGQGLGPTPLETFLGSVAACTAFDVMSVLAKKRQVVTSYRVYVEGDRQPIEAGWPRPYTEIRVRHVLSGENLDRDAVARALALSEEKYCSVAATIRLSPPIKNVLDIEE